MESGWTRWILEQFEFPFTRVYAPELDAGNLNAKYDVLVFVERRDPGGAVGGGRRRTRRSRRWRRARSADDSRRVPFAARTRDRRRTIPQIRAFIENGGTVVALSDSAMNLAQQLKLPIENHLVENGAPLPRVEVLRPGLGADASRSTRRHPLARGHDGAHRLLLRQQPGVQARRPAPRRQVSAPSRGSTRPTPLRSGWAWGQKYLEGGVAAIEARMGKGRVVLYGPEILQRAQPHGTFKLLFNALYSQ